MENSLLRPAWQKVFRLDIIFITVMFVLLGIIRVTGLYREEIYLVVSGFLIMWVLPFIFFSKNGRRRIGVKKPERWLWLILSFLLGAIVAIAFYFIGYLLYGTGIENWGMTVAREFSDQEEVLIPVVFAVVTLLSMLFSPIGEELFFRGMIQEVLAERLTSYKLASFWGSFLFAAIHLPHHDIFFSGLGYFSIIIPLAIWFVMMYLVSILFIFARIKSGSIFGAIACHSGYILGMNLFIYHFLLQ